MQIQWYPGHMHKASKEMRKILPTIDLVIEILDARIPFSSENPMINDLRQGKPCIKVLSKSDLADPELTGQWQDYLERECGVKTLALTTEEPDKMRRLLSLARKMTPEKRAGMKPVHALIMGIPNVGKSTLINILAGRTIAKTGNEPAVTKNQQRIQLDEGIVLFDSPGVLWPNVENRNSGYRLAVTGAIKDTAMEYDDVAWFAAGYLLQHYPDNLRERYQLDATPESETELLEVIGRRRGCLVSGGRVDFEKASRLLLMELRAGKLGRLTLETPSMMEKELAELVVIREAKAAKKALRKSRRGKNRS